MSSRRGAGPSQRRGSGSNREKARDEPNIPEYPLQLQQRKHRTNAFSQDGDVDLNAMRFRQHEMTVPWDERYKDYFSDACLLQTQRIESSGDCVSVKYLVFLEDLSQLHIWAWGSGVLAYLYRELCKGVTDRRDKNPKGHMGTHRDQFDIMRPEEVNWTPYEDFRPLLPPICEEERTLTLIPVPLICLHIVEMYHPDRVMRQFGLLQMIPPLNCVYDKELHEMKFEGGDDCLYDKELHDVRYGRGDDWPVVHEEYLQLWQEKWEFWTTLPASGPYDPSMVDAYLDWYARSTNHFVQTTIPHNSATYYPMVPATRRAVIY
ncbi:hypothetical protein LUZ60_003641 [Juncus effusus]|nr:hypothetical protein LUZ60_003641 [Juncus effusus]